MINPNDAKYSVLYSNFCRHDRSIYPSSWHLFFVPLKALICWACEGILGSFGIIYISNRIFSPSAKAVIVSSNNEFSWVGQKR